MLNSLNLNKKRVFAEISSEDIRYDERIKCDNWNMLNVDGKSIYDKFPKSLDIVQKQASTPM